MVHKVRELFIAVRFDGFLVVRLILFRWFVFGVFGGGRCFVWGRPIVICFVGNIWRWVNWFAVPQIPLQPTIGCNCATGTYIRVSVFVRGRCGRMVLLHWEFSQQNEKCHFYHKIYSKKFIVIGSNDLEPGTSQNASQFQIVKICFCLCCAVGATLS